ncbi:hypothetical protein GE09DRAFT_774395 [Coniochaeta sp. 2T2.1]|nr:hypothetical protein GE09DRAFT_774395 [Coniochaeta sp. 2T2.1]
MPLAGSWWLLVTLDGAVVQWAADTEPRRNVKSTVLGLRLSDSQMGRQASARSGLVLSCCLLPFPQHGLVAGTTRKGRRQYTVRYQTGKAQRNGECFLRVWN